MHRFLFFKVESKALELDWRGFWLTWLKNHSVNRQSLQTIHGLKLLMG